MLRRNGIPCDEVRKHFEAAQRRPARAVGRRRDPRRRGRHGDQHPVRQLRPAHRRLRDPFGRSGDEHPLRDDGAGRLGGRAGHRGGHPRRHRRDVAAGAAQRAGAAEPWAGSVGRLADAVSQRGPLCLGIDPHPELLRAWGLPTDADGLRQRSATSASRRSPASRWSSRRWRSSRPTARRDIAVLERTIAALRDVGRAGAGRRQARRHRLDDGGLRRRLGRRLAAGRRRRHCVAVSRIRFAAAAAGHRRGARPRRVRAGRHVQPGGRERAARRRPTAAPWRSRSSTPPPRSTATRRPSPVRSASSSAPRCPTPPDLSALGGPVLVPGVGAQGGRPEALRGFGGARPGQLLPAVSREVLRAGPDVGRACVPRPSRCVMRWPIWHDRL